MSDFNIPTAAEAISFTEARCKQVMDALMEKIGSHIRASVRRVLDIQLDDAEIVMVTTVLCQLKDLGYNARLTGTGRISISW